MAERDTFVDVDDGDQLNSGFFNGIGDRVTKTVIQDQTGGSHTGDTNETELIADVSIPANTADTGILVMVVGNSAPSADGQTNNFKLYAGTSTTATSNTLYRTVGVAHADAGNFAQWTMIYFITNLTFSSQNYVNVTVTLENGGGSGVLESITIIPI